MSRADYTPPTFTDVPQSQWGSPPAGAVPMDAAHLNAAFKAIGNSVRQDSDLVNVKDYGAKGDLRTVTDAAVTGTTLTSTAAAFIAADAGKQVDIFGAGASLAGPTPTLSTATTGGSLAGSQTLSVRMTATNAYGESAPGTAATIAIPAGTSTNTVTVQYPTVAGATGYKVYIGTAGSEQLAATFGIPNFPNYGSNSGWIYTGATAPSGALPSSGSAWGTHSTTIASVSNGTATLTAAALHTGSGLTAQCGTDDAAAIAATVAAAGTNGTVYFPSGTYLHSAVLTPRAGQTWRGAGNTKTVLRRVEPGQSGGQPSRSIYPVAADSVTLEDLAVDGGRLTANGTFNAIVQVESATRAQLRNVRAFNVHYLDTAFALRACTDSSVRGAIVETAGYGIRVGGRPSDSHASSDCIVDGARISNVDYNGIFVTGDQASGPGPESVYRHKVSRSIITGFSDTGIEMGEGCVDCTVSDVVIDGLGAGANGLLIRDNDGTVATGFIIRGVGAARNNGAGITALTLQGLPITNCILGPGKVSGCGVGAQFYNTQGLTMTGVVASGNLGVGMLLADVQRARLTGCAASSNGDDGIIFGVLGTSAAKHVRVVGCDAVNNGQNKTATTYCGFNVTGTGTTDVAFSCCGALDDQATATQYYGFFYNATAAPTNCWIDPSCFNTGNITAGSFNSSSGVGAMANSGRIFPDLVDFVAPITASNYSVADNYRHVIADGTSITITLPSASNRRGRTISVTNMNATSATIATSGSTNHGATTLAQGITARYISDGTGWYPW